MTKYPKKFLKKLETITAKRPKTVIDHILKHGFVTTQELEELYGYTHAPRAARDVRELGIPLETYRVKATDGRIIAAYRFGDLSKVDYAKSKASGRTVLSKALKKALIEKYGSQCFIYMQPMEERLLQVDHRVPFEIAGENALQDVDSYMLLCPSANRAKSWTCEHCSNWANKDIAYCLSCFWANPEHHTHVADKTQRQIIITFTGDEVDDYLKLIELVGVENAEQKIKEIIKDSILK